MSDFQKKFFCPRLLDYIVIVGSRNPCRNNSVAQTPELLRRYPQEDHKDFPLAPDVIFFCQPEGCINVGPKRMSLRECTSFVFTLTEKDTGRTRYGICVNFYRPFERRGNYSGDRNKSERHTSVASSTSTSSGEQGVLHPPTTDDERSRSPRTKRKQKTASRVRNNTLTSLCIISHHPFFSTFRECLFVLRKLIDSCNERSCSKRIGGSRAGTRDTVWGLLTGQASDCTPSLVMHDVREIETWILRLLSAPVPVPGRTRVEVSVLPRELHQSMVFALPDHTRFSLVDFPLHLPLELLGVDMCVKVLTCIILEHKLVLQSRDYNALTMSVMAFVTMLYPLEYMFPVIPLLPTCMSSAEQLLLAPTPYIIGLPTSFLMYKKGFHIPDDVWLVDLDSNKMTPPPATEELTQLPEPEVSVLKNHLKQVLEVRDECFLDENTSHVTALASMSMSPQPIKNLDAITQNPEMLKRKPSFSSAHGFNPLIYGNDVDSVDIATRVAMVRFFNSPNILANFAEHTRTLRLYPRPVVAFQLFSFIKSRPVKTKFTSRLAKTQAVEYFAEWTLSPTNVVFQRIQTGMYDPLLIGDKAKWYSQSLQKVDFKVYDDCNSTLGAAIASSLDVLPSDDNPTDESGSDSDGAESTSSSYSSLSDFVIDIQNSEINGETPMCAEDQVLTVDESCVYSPPQQLQVPDLPMSTSDSALSAPDSDDDDSEEDSPNYADELDDVGNQRGHSQSQPLTINTKAKPNLTPPVKEEGVFQYDTTARRTPPAHYDSQTKREEGVFRYDSGKLTPTSKNEGHFRYDFANNQGHNHSTVPGGTPEMARRSPIPMHRAGSELESSRSRTSSSNSPGGKTPPQRPPPPSPAALERSLSQQRRTPPPLDRQAAVEKQCTVDRSSTLDRQTNVIPNHPHPIQPQAKKISPKSGKHREHLQKGQGQDLGDDKSSILDTITDELNGYAQTASNTITELFASNKSPSPSIISSAGSTTSKASKPFAPLGNRKALVEKSGLVKHASSQKKAKDLQRQGSDIKGNTHSENQQFLKDIVTSVLDGQGVGWLKVNRVKKLMEDENYRNFVVSRLNTSLNKKLTDEDQHLEDVCVTKAVFKGMLAMIKAFLFGLEHTYQNQGIGGMASTMMVLEIMHTHYWEKESTSGSSNKSDASNPSLASSPFGSRESLSSMVADTKSDMRSLHDDHMVAALDAGSRPNSKIKGRVIIQGDSKTKSSKNSTNLTCQTGTPVILNGDEYENIELRPAVDVPLPDSTSNNNGDMENYNQGAHLRGVTDPRGTLPSPGGTPLAPPGVLISDLERQRDSSGYGSESGDMLRELVKNKELMTPARRKHLAKLNSMDSDVSEGSTLMGLTRKKRSGSILSGKSHLSSGYRYHDGHILNLNLPSPDTHRNYLFEHFISKERSYLWDQMQFWEDSFLDAVAQERDIIGMDQGPSEMMERYSSLGDSERKRLEHDEDRILSISLYNMVAFMTMMRVSKNEARRKIRRMLGKCHIGLACSAEINHVLDQINNLNGNDIDLKPLGSRLMQKLSFTVHWGADNTGDMLFMEVCDDCLILRSVTGSICDRWWFEKLVNMTYCPKTKVLCLWRRHEGKTQLNKFYTKKCKELYFCVKESMEKAAARNSGRTAGPELGGEFPVQDLKSGQGGLLQVCMEGLGLLFANSKFFIELGRIKKCYTLRGGLFVLEEFDPKTRKIIQRKYRSNMANSIVLAFHRVVSTHPSIHKTQTANSQNDRDHLSSEETESQRHLERLKDFD